MLSRIYLVERDTASDILPAHKSVSRAARVAIVAAINEHPGIRYEELTDPHNRKPVIAVTFNDELSMDHFDGLIEATFSLTGIRVRVMRATKAYAARQAHNGNSNRYGCATRGP
jgi:hypothetical protein